MLAAPQSVIQLAGEEVGGGVLRVNRANHRQKNSITHHIRYHLNSLSLSLSPLSLSPCLFLPPQVCSQLIVSALFALSLEILQN